MRQMNENDWSRMRVLVASAFAALALSGCSDRPNDPLSPVRPGNARPRFEITPTPGSWATMAAMPTARQGAVAGVIAGKLYVAGGSGGTASDYYPYPRFRALEVYDPATGTWTIKAPMPIGVNGGAAVGVIGERLYVAGGAASADAGNEQAAVQMYDPVTDAWAFKAPMPVANSGMAFGVIEGKLYVTGGSRNDNDRALRVYDPVADTWVERAPVPDDMVAGMAAGVIDGKLYVAGGSGAPCFSTGCTIIGTLRVYDPSTNTWDMTRASMPTPMSLHSVGVLNGHLHVIGGVTGCGNCNVGETIHQVYDPVTNHWTIDMPMPTGRASFVSGVIDGRLYATGGASGTWPNTSWKNALEVYTPAAAGKTDQAITFNAVASQTYGNSPFAISATASSGLLVSFASIGNCAVSGTTVTITGAGNCTLTASQAGDGNFNAAPSVTQSVAIAKAVPTIIWNAPASMVYGEALGSTQLNATATGIDDATLSGVFSYSPAAGTVLNVGLQTLVANFTPDDVNNYTDATTRVVTEVLYSTAIGHVFLQPINLPSQQASVFKAGSTIPVKFTLFMADGVTRVSTAVATIEVRKVSNGVPDGTPVEVVSTVPNAGTTFRYDTTAQQYLFNLGTKGWTAGSYQITARLDDGSQITVVVGAR